MAITTRRVGGGIVLIVGGQRITIMPSQIRDVIAVLEAEAQ